MSIDFDMLTFDCLINENPHAHIFAKNNEIIKWITTILRCGVALKVISSAIYNTMYHILLAEVQAYPYSHTHHAILESIYFSRALPPPRITVVHHGLVVMANACFKSCASIKLLCHSDICIVWTLYRGGEMESVCNATCSLHIYRTC